MSCAKMPPAKEAYLARPIKGDRCDAWLNCCGCFIPDRLRRPDFWTGVTEFADVLRSKAVSVYFDQRGLREYRNDHCRAGDQERGFIQLGIWHGRFVRHHKWGHDHLGGSKDRHDDSGHVKFGSSAGNRCRRVGKAIGAKRKRVQAKRKALQDRKGRRSYQADH